MSDASPPAPPEGPRQPLTPPRGGFATALMVLFGLILLLPGLCAILFGALSWPTFEPAILSLILLGLLVGFAGVMLIRAAIKGRRR